jgi:predicted GNAT family acetyltransferase
MDDLKLIAKSEEELQRQIQTVKTFSDDIHMEFGLEKCAKITLKRGKLISSQNLVIDNNREIQELEQGKTYRYLGIEESEGIQRQQMKDRLKQEYNRRVRMVLKSELDARNKITAIGALAVPILRYSFGIINWRLEEIKQIDRKTRKMLTMYKMHHPKADIDRLYVKRKEGGRGLAQVAVVYKREIINIAEYLNTKYKGDQFVNIVKSQESTHPNMSSIVKLAAKFTEDLHQLNKKNDAQKNETQHTMAKWGEVIKKK